jgi:DNA-binding transcriptional ArsR family regulator
VSARPRRLQSPARLAGAAPLFAALGDETRLALVLRLGSGGPHSIAQLAAESPYTRQAITKHLEVLSAAGLVRSDRRGRERIWTVEADRLDAARRYLDQVSLQWDAALGRLKQFVEE